MAEIRPFRAWRYAPEFFRQPMDVLSPMYDGFDDAFFQQLYQQPHSSLHLAMPRDLGAAQAAGLQWRATGVLRQDPLPSFYPFFQTFSLFGHSTQQVRRGFLALVRISPEGEPDTLVPHEGVLPARVAQRAELLQQMQMQLTPTHGLYSDPYFRLEPLLAAYMEAPLMDATDFQGVRSQLSMAVHRKDLDRMREVLAPKKIYIADGHHRVAASRRLLRRALEQNPNLSAHHPYRYHLMYLSNMRGHDLQILPIHRVLRMPAGHTHAQLATDLQLFFELTEHRSRQSLYEAIRDRAHTLGLVWQGRQLILSLRPELDPLELIEPRMPSSVKDLDYTLLHYLVLDKILGMPYEEQATQLDIRYVPQAQEAIRQASDTHAAFILNGVPMRSLLAVCNDEWLMPAKSTFFFPKLMNGLVFASLREADYQAPHEALFLSGVQPSAVALQWSRLAGDQAILSE